jgi:hypothetical protein
MKCCTNEPGGASVPIGGAPGFVENVSTDDPMISLSQPAGRRTGIAVAGKVKIILWSLMPELSGELLNATVMERVCLVLGSRLSLYGCFQE